jgi:hypothetical protein
MTAIRRFHDRRYPGSPGWCAAAARQRQTADQARHWPAAAPLRCRDLPGSAFGEPPGALRLQLATSLLYGDSQQQQQEAGLAAPDPPPHPATARLGAGLPACRTTFEPGATASHRRNHRQGAGHDPPPLHLQSPPVRRTAGWRTCPPGPKRPAEPRSAPSPHRSRRPVTAPGSPDIPPTCHMSPSSGQASTCPRPARWSFPRGNYPPLAYYPCTRHPGAQHCRRRHAQLADPSHRSRGAVFAACSAVALDRARKLDGI